MSQLQKQAEQKLINCARMTQGYVSDGLEPDEALAKAASDCSLPFHMLSHAVAAYNTGVQTYTMEKAARDHTGILAAIEEFPIAHLENVQSRLYPDRDGMAKTAMTALQQSVSPEYARRPETRTFRQKQADAALAAIKFSSPKPLELAPRDRMRQYSEMQGKKEMIRRGVDEARCKSSQARDAAVLSVSRLRDYFRGGTGIGPAEAFTGSCVLFGKSAELLFSHIFPGHGFVKVAALPRPADSGAAPYRMIKEALDRLSTAATAAMEHIELARVAPIKEAELSRPFDVPTPRDALSPPDCLRPVPASPVGSTPKAAASFLSPAITGVSAGVGSSFTKAVDPQIAKDRTIDSFAATLDEPSHMEEMKSINARAVLHDLMRNDEVISGFDPSEIIDAYNEMATLSPTSVARTAQLRPLLRRRLTGGGLELADVQQAAATDELVRKTQSMPVSAGQKGLLAGDAGYISGA